MNEKNNEELLDECAYLIDMAIMLGDKLLKLHENAEAIEVLPEAAKIISSYIGKKYFYHILSRNQKLRSCIFNF